MSKKIEYNSWLEKHKEPYGAVHAGAKVNFSIVCRFPDIQEITLMIHKDYGESAQVPLEEVRPETFETSFYLMEGQGLYFYYFQIHYQENGFTKTVYYGNNGDSYGGEGEIYYEPEDVQHYQITAYLYEDSSPEWYREGIAYHIFVDRFFNGNEGGGVLNPKPNSFLYATDEDAPMYIRNEIGEVVRWEFFGGNLKGIIQKLPYLEEMGVTILYLSPIFEARSNHKYDTGDYLKVDSMFGDEATLKELIHKAKTHGMRLILDGVFNHTGADSRYFNRFGTYDSLGAYQSLDSPYAHWYTFHQFPEDFEAWWGVKDVPTLNKQSKEIRSFLYQGDESVIHKWSKLGLGGWRIDVADELPDDFLKGIRDALEESLEEPVLIGEVWEDASNKISYDVRRHYIEGGILHGVMNYPFRKMIIGLVNRTASPQNTVKESMKLKENYPPAVLKSNLNNIGSHDTTRILTSLQEDLSKLKQALVLLFTLPGVPCVYYGDEAGMIGGNDPENRGIYPWGRENTEIQALVRRLSHYRRQEDALKQGDFYAFSAGRLYGLLRYLNEEESILVLVNPAEQSVVFNPEKIRETMDIDIKNLVKQTDWNQLSIEAGSFCILKRRVGTASFQKQMEQQQDEPQTK